MKCSYSGGFNSLSQTRNPHFILIDFNISSALSVHLKRVMSCLGLNGNSASWCRGPRWAWSLRPSLQRLALCVPKLERFSPVRTSWREGSQSLPGQRLLLNTSGWHLWSGWQRKLFRDFCFTLLVMAILCRGQTLIRGKKTHYHFCRWGNWG